MSSSEDEETSTSGWKTETPVATEDTVAELQQQLKVTAARLSRAEEREKDTRCQLNKAIDTAPLVNRAIKDLIGNISVKVADNFVKWAAGHPNSTITKDPEILSHLDEARDASADRYMKSIKSRVHDGVWESWARAVRYTEHGSLFADYISRNVSVRPESQSNRDTYIVSHGELPSGLGNVMKDYTIDHPFRRSFTFKNEVSEADVKETLEDVTRDLY